MTTQTNQTATLDDRTFKYIRQGFTLEGRRKPNMVYGYNNREWTDQHAARNAVACGLLTAEGIELTSAGLKLICDMHS